LVTGSCIDGNRGCGQLLLRISDEYYQRMVSTTTEARRNHTYLATQSIEPVEHYGLKVKGNSMGQDEKNRRFKCEATHAHGNGLIIGSRGCLQRTIKRSANSKFESSSVRAPYARPKELGAESSLRECGVRKVRQPITLKAA